MPCPVNIKDPKTGLVKPCPRKAVPSNWFHYNCGGKTWFRYDDLEIVCKDCGSSGLMFDWKFSC